MFNILRCDTMANSISQNACSLRSLIYTRILSGRNGGRKNHAFTVFLSSLDTTREEYGETKRFGWQGEPWQNMKSQVMFVKYLL